MEVIPLINADSFLVQDNAIFLHLKSLKEYLVFHDINYVLKHKQNIFFLFSIQNIKSNCYVIFLKFFQLSFSDGKFIPSQSHLFVKDIIFVILCRSFFISSWFKAIVTAYWKHLLSFLLLGSIVAFLFFIQLCCFFVFYPVRKIYMWSTTIRILSLTWFLCYHFLSLLHALHHYLWKK